jgi:eukaryotic-like serine/threonine-protein kinase
MTKDPACPSKIGRYEILGTVGRGNMGNVYFARDPMIGRLVAIKTRRFDIVEEEKERGTFIDKFFEEARIAGNLIHPGIVTVFDVGRDEDECFIAMELLEGESLASFTKSENLMGPARVAELVRYVATALDFAHSNGVIHRDIKPANLMFTKDLRIKITDFGIATVKRASESGDFQIVGTPSYMSPEQTKGLKLTPQTDLFSLGVVFYELLLGRRPFHGRTLYELMDTIRYSPAASILTFNPDLPPGLDDVIQRTLEKEPDRRYASGLELASEIEQAMKGRRIPRRDIKTTKKADLLKSIQFFRGFSGEEIEEIIRLGAFIRYNPSQVIVREGDVDTTFFVLVSGTVRVYRNNRKIEDLHKGSVFGEMGAFTNSQRTAHVIAREICIVLKLDLKLIERESGDLKIKFYQVFIETLVSRLEKTTKRYGAQQKALARVRDRVKKLSLSPTAVLPE